MKGTVYAQRHDYCLLKVLLTTSVAHCDLAVKKNVGESFLLSLDPKSKSILLETPTGLITQHVAILRYIAEMGSASLMGSEEIERAQIDQWLDYSWNDLGNVLLNIFSSIFNTMVLIFFCK